MYWLGIALSIVALSCWLPVEKLNSNSPKKKRLLFIFHSLLSGEPSTILTSCPKFNRYSSLALAVKVTLNSYHRLSVPGGCTVMPFSLSNNSRPVASRNLSLNESRACWGIKAMRFGFQANRKPREETQRPVELLILRFYRWLFRRFG